MLRTGVWILRKWCLVDGIKLTDFDPGEFSTSAEAYAKLMNAYSLRGIMKLATENRERMLRLNRKNRELTEILKQSKTVNL